LSSILLKIFIQGVRLVREEVPQLVNAGVGDFIRNLTRPQGATQ